MKVLYYCDRNFTQDSNGDCVSVYDCRRLVLVPLLRSLDLVMLADLPIEICGGLVMPMYSVFASSEQPETIWLMVSYNTLILPYLNYCNIVWGNCHTTKFNHILLLRKKAVRICTNLSHTNPLFHRLKVFKIHDINTLQIAIEQHVRRAVNTRLVAPSSSCIVRMRN